VRVARDCWCHTADGACMPCGIITVLYLCPDDAALIVLEGEPTLTIVLCNAEGLQMFRSALTVSSCQREDPYQDCSRAQQRLWPWQEAPAASLGMHRPQQPNASLPNPVTMQFNLALPMGCSRFDAQQKLHSAAAADLLTNPSLSSQSTPSRILVPSCRALSFCPTSQTAKGVEHCDAQQTMQVLSCAQSCPKPFVVSACLAGDRQQILTL